MVDTALVDLHSNEPLPAIPFHEAVHPRFNTQLPNGIRVYSVNGIDQLIHMPCIATDVFRSPVIWYRGHADETWKLETVLDRKGLRTKEQDLMAQFIRGAPLRTASTPAGNNIPEWLALARHFKLPVRLLDWTELPLVAAHFAVESWSMSIPGAIWALNAGALNQNTLGSYTLPFMENREVRPLIAPVTSREADVDSRVAAVLPPLMDLRMLIQEGRFTIHGVSLPLEELEVDRPCLIKFVISEEAKEAIRRHLRLLGLKTSTLFPDLDHLAEFVTDWVETPLRIRPIVKSDSTIGSA